MDLEFIKDLCKKINLSPEACDTALRVLLTEEKAIRRAQKHAGLAHLHTPYRRLRKNRADGVAFCLGFALAEAERAFGRYKQLGIPEAIYYDTMQDISVWVNTCAREEGIVGLCELSWIRHALYLNLFQIGRLQYQFFKTNHTVSGIPAGLCAKVPIGSRQPALNIHIPEGGRLDFSACQQSLQEARVFFWQYFPQYKYAGFVCDSWLLDRHNAQFMREDSNILQFASLFDCVVQTRFENNELLRRLWGIHKASREELALLPEDTDLQKRAKQYLLNGGKTGSGYGFIIK